jgi:hypothetical protein
MGAAALAISVDLLMSLNAAPSEKAAAGETMAQDAEASVAMIASLNFFMTLPLFPLRQAGLIAQMPIGTCRSLLLQIYRAASLALAMKLTPGDFDPDKSIDQIVCKCRFCAKPGKTKWSSI